MAAISDSDVSIDASGNIRWTGAATTNRHTVLEFIQWLMDKQDDETASGDDLLDITVDTPFNRSTDQIVTLNAPFNIDDTFATHLYDGSVSQTNTTTGEEDLYSGLGVIGPVETGTEYMILQGGKVLPAFWGTGINAEASPSLVFSRHLVKSKVGGSEIDGQRITVLARELGDQYRRFPVTLGTGNSVAAIANGADIFNEKTDATLAGYEGTITNTEGYQGIDIDGAGTTPPDNEYYSQWDTGGQSINDVYEYTKWITQRSHVADSTGGTPTGADFVIENGTIDGQAQSFIPRSTTELLTEARANVKILAGSPTGTIYAELYDSDDAASQLAEPTGALLARSEDVLASSITSSYEEVIFRFNRFNPATGADQIDGLRLTNAEYFIVFRHDAGDASNNFSLEGASTDQDSTMNQADSTAATWTASATDDINITVKSSPVIHGVPGEIFQGINVQVGYDGETGTTGVSETEATNDELAIWGTAVTYDTLVGTFNDWEHVIFENAGTLVTGGQILWDNGSTDMVVALDSPAAAVIADGYTITGIESGATAAINVTFSDEDKSGGAGLVLAKDDNGADGEVYLQVITGANPVDNNRIRSRANGVTTDYVDATSSITTRTLNPEFVGTSTGSNIIGAYGIGFDPNDVGSSDLFTDLSNTNRTPPNNQTFTVSGLVASQDRVLVGPRTGTSLERNQWYLNTALTGATETAVVVKAGAGSEAVTPIADDIPSVGTGNTALRIENDDGIYRRQAYNTITRATNTFNITSSDYSGAQGSATYQASANNDVFVAFIDVLADATTESYTAEYVSDRDLFVRVRDGGGTPIKTFESTSAQFKSTPQTVAAVRTNDF